MILYAVFGTIIAASLTGGAVYWFSELGIFKTKFNLINAFAFGSFISATDPVAVLSIFKEISVNKTLYTLVFGESILNDAVSLILFETCVKIKLSHDRQSYVDPVWHFFGVFFGSVLIGMATENRTTY